MGRGTRVGKERKRVEVAKALVAGELPSKIAPKLGCSTAYVGELAAEPETRSLAERFLAPHYDELRECVAESVAATRRGLKAKRDDPDDYKAQLTAVSRCCDLLELAQGGKRDQAAQPAGYTLIQIHQLLALTAPEEQPR